MVESGVPVNTNHRRKQEADNTHGTPHPISSQCRYPPPSGQKTKAEYQAIIGMCGIGHLRRRLHVHTFAVHLACTGQAYKAKNEVNVIVVDSFAS